MKIAVCSQNRKTVTGHAGKCRRFRIFEIESGRVVAEDWIELPLEGTLQASAAEADHPLFKMDVLISAGMGEGLVRRLKAQQVQPFITDLTDPLEAVNAYLAGAFHQDPTEESYWHSPCSCRQREDTNTGA